ncbi:hypothetical protein [Bacteroides finegoldii]|jgi:putative lipoprotein|uniref:hypothetical protein n=1 Tax=Bacteroides finegoldii TaxID=338188 RepID=UPI0022E81700|nr:hypothetical protein [Bacteroides finegoldii]
MKANLLYGAAIWTFLSAAAFFSGCSDDDAYKDVDGQSPTLELTSDHVRTLTGYEFKIAGKITDKDGIRSIQLKCSELYLDKMIDLSSIYSEPLYEYDLNYGFTIPAKTEGDSFTVKVAVTDLGGRVSENNVLITMDGDYTKPILSPSTGLFSTDINIVLSEGTSKKFKFTAKDEGESDRGLGYLELRVPDLDILERVEMEEEGIKNGTLECTVTFPSDKTGTYPLTICAADWLGNITEKEYTVLVSKVEDYKNLYLVDFEGTDNKLLTGDDVWGIPMPIERSTNFTYKARYYSATPNTPIRFVSSKSSFNVCFGDDKNAPGKLTGISEDVQPIILPEKGYYEIVMNTEEGTYAVKKYIPDDEPLIEGSDQIAYNPDDSGREEYKFKLGLAGDGFTGAGWNTNNLLYLKQDADNLYCFTTELEIPKTGNVKLTITPNHPWGWWPSPFWRFDGKNEIFVPENGLPDNVAKYVSKGTYTFVFDTHLCQSKLLKK